VIEKVNMYDVINLLKKDSGKSYAKVLSLLLDVLGMVDIKYEDQ